MKEREIDRMIREALREEDAALLESVGGEQSMYRQWLDLFRGGTRWMVVVSVIVTVVLMVIAVLAALRFYRATEMREMALWGTICLACLGGVAVQKIWGWMEMNKTAVMREVKRLELQVAQVAKAVTRLSEKANGG